LAQKSPNKDLPLYRFLHTSAIRILIGGKYAGLVKKI
jgi:hypothetical protein